jgi:hypothetical protein
LAWYPDASTILCGSSPSFDFSPFRLFSLFLEGFYNAVAPSGGFEPLQAEPTDLQNLSSRSMAILRFSRELA